MKFHGISPICWNGPYGRSRVISWAYSQFWLGFIDTVRISSCWITCLTDLLIKFSQMLGGLLGTSLRAWPLASSLFHKGCLMRRYGITSIYTPIASSRSLAQIATLPPEFGLYSSFVGVFFYCVCQLHLFIWIWELIGLASSLPPPRMLPLGLLPSCHLPLQVLSSMCNTHIPINGQGQWLHLL